MTNFNASVVMEDYIFLIIAVVISIFAAIKKNKKKEPIVSPVAEKEDEPENYFMDQLFNLDFPEDDEEERIPAQITPVAKKEPLMAPAPMRTQLNYQPTFKSLLPDRSGRGIQSLLKKERELKDDIEDETDESTDYLEDFSLRKAFVYSEIMNPKYLQETGS